MPEQVERLLIRPAEVARMMGISRAKVYELIGSGALPAVRIAGGRLLRIPLSALTRLAEGAGEIDETAT